MSDISKAVRDKLFAKGYFLVTDVTHENIRTLMNFIVENRPQKNEFTIVISSSGGSSSAVIYFASFLSTLSADVKLKGVAFGECGSAALALLQCCHERVGVKHCGFFIHHIKSKFQYTAYSNGSKRFRADLKRVRLLEEELVALQCARSGISRKIWMKLADAGEADPGSEILPKKALKLGLIDRIEDHCPIF